MSLIQQLSSLVNNYGLSLKTEGPSCYSAKDKSITIDLNWIKETSKAIGVSETLMTIAITLHELGHATQSESLLFLYSFNPLPSEEDAWDRAIDLFKKFSKGSNPSENFYRIRDYCLGTYYTLHSSKINWG